MSDDGARLMLRRLARESVMIVAVLVYGVLLALVTAPRRLLAVLPWSPVQVAAGVSFALLVGASAGLVVVAS